MAVGYREKQIEDKMQKDCWWDNKGEIVIFRSANKLSCNAKSKNGSDNRHKSQTKQPNIEKQHSSLS